VITITYKRPETDEEMATRHAREAEEEKRRQERLLVGHLHRNCWPALLRLRSGIVGLGFQEKTRRRAGFEILPPRTCSLPLPHRHFAVCTHRIGTGSFAEKPEFGY
jgi:hypothetical protein